MPMQTGLPLEDNEEDIILKACLAHGVRGKLPNSPEERRRFIREKLKLDPDALAALKNYRPIVNFPEGLIQHTFDFDLTSLNIWTLQYDSSVVIVDAGYHPIQFDAVMTRVGVSMKHPPEAILITHWHRDHIGGLTACPHCPIICERTENISNNPNPVIEFKIAAKPWKIFRLPGHSDDSLGFFTEYKDHKLLFSGDALFAGSIGRNHESANFNACFTQLMNALRSLPDDTLVLPGHGPASTIGLEWENNPFLKGKK